jgi:hypothetical protein
LDDIHLNEHIRFPKGFKPPRYFKWKGQGNPPAAFG